MWTTADVLICCRQPTVLMPSLAQGVRRQQFRAAQSSCASKTGMTFCLCLGGPHTRDLVELFSNP